MFSSSLGPSPIFWKNSHALVGLPACANAWTRSRRGAARRRLAFPPGAPAPPGGAGGGLDRKAGAETAAWIRTEIKANDGKQLAQRQEKGAKIGRPALGPWRDSVKPVYAKAREKYGADVDQFIADADAVRKALPAK